MHKIIVEQECGCFRRSGLANNISIESKDEALEKAIDMQNEMNATFCGKHGFQVFESSENFSPCLFWISFSPKVMAFSNRPSL